MTCARGGSARQRSIVIALIGIGLLAACLRLWSVDQFPVFIDEDIYTQAALETKQRDLPEALGRSPRAAYGKPPLPFIVQAALTRVVPDPVLAGRVMSAGAGTVTTILCYALGTLAAGRWVGLATAALYAVSPFAVLHERMVLQDGPMATFALSSAVAGWRAVRQRSFLWAAIAALAGALAVQLKTPAIAVAAFPYLALITCEAGIRARLGLATVIAAVPALVYLGLFLGPFGPALALQNRGILAPPFSSADNAIHLADALRTYFPGPLLLLIPLGIATMARSRPRWAIVLFVATAAWALPWLLVSRFSPARYYLPAVPFLCAFAGLALVSTIQLIRWRPALRLGLVAVVIAVSIGVPGFESWRLASAHATAAMSSLDHDQYRGGWPSGYSYQQLRDFISATAEPGSTVVYAIDVEHWIAAGGERTVFTSDRTIRLRPGNLRRPRDPFPFDRSTAVYLAIDDRRDATSPGRIAAALEWEPRLEPIQHFNRLGSELGISVLRLAPLAERPGPPRCGYRLLEGSTEEGSRGAPALTEGPGTVRLSLFSETAGTLLLTGELRSAADDQAVSIELDGRVQASVSTPARRAERFRVLIPLETSGPSLLSLTNVAQAGPANPSRRSLVLGGLSLRLMDPETPCVGMES